MVPKNEGCDYFEVTIRLDDKERKTYVYKRLGIELFIREV